MPRASISPRFSVTILFSPPARAMPPSSPFVRAEVERGQEVDRGCSPPAMLVQLVLHRGGEVVVDQPGEVPLQQADHGEREERRDQRLPRLNTYPRSWIVCMIDAYVDGRPMPSSSIALTS